MKEALEITAIRPVNGAVALHARCAECAFVIVGGVQLCPDGIEELRAGILVPVLPHQSDEEFDAEVEKLTEFTFDVRGIG